MACIPIDSIQLHNTLFMCGRNFTDKRIKCNGQTIQMWYSTVDQIILALYQNHVAIIGGASGSFDLKNFDDYKHFEDFKDLDLESYKAKTVERAKPVQTPTSPIARQVDPGIQAQINRANPLVQAAQNQAKGLPTAQVWDPSQPQNQLTKLAGAPKYRPHPTRSKPDPVPAPIAPQPDPIPDPNA